MRVFRSVLLKQPPLTWCYPVRSRAMIGLVAVLAMTGCGGGGGAPGTTTDATSSLSDAGAAALDPARLQRTTTTAVSVTMPMTCTRASPLPVRPAQYLSVTDFGARPDDDNDDASAIIAALEAAKPGQWVVFPPGRYIQSKSISVNKVGVTLWGQGATLHATNPADQAILLRADDTKVYGFTLTAVTEARRSEPWNTRICANGYDTAKGYIRGVVIQGNSVVAADRDPGGPLSNGASAAGIAVVGVRDFTIANNFVERTLADGIHVTGGSQNGRVIDNKVKETGDDMIAVVSYLDKAWRTKAKDSSTWFSTVGSSSLVKDIYIARNEVSGQYWGRGIAVVGGSGITVRENTVSKTATGAGILVARERSYETHGVSNVLVENNNVTLVQTTAPAYVPSGSFFSTYSDRYKVNQGRSGQAGIEIHNTSSLTDIQDPVLSPKVQVADVLVSNNVVSDVVRDAIRVGADSNQGSISGVVLVKNKLQAAINSPIMGTSADGSFSIFQCSENSYDGKSYGVANCIAPKYPMNVTGAILACGVLY